MNELFIFTMEVKQLLSELFRPVRVNFPRRRFEYKSIDDNLQLDIADLSKLAKANSNYKFILVSVNPFTKMIYAEKLKRSEKSFPQRNRFFFRTFLVQDI